MSAVMRIYLSINTIKRSVGENRAKDSNRPSKNRHIKMTKNSLNRSGKKSDIETLEISVSPSLLNLMRATLDRYSSFTLKAKSASYCSTNTIIAYFQGCGAVRLIKSYDFVK